MSGQGRLRYVAVGILLMVVAALWSGRAVAYPEPQIVPTSWEFDFRYSTPAIIAVREPDEPTKLYWYMTYTVTNRSGEDRLFIPTAMALTDAGDLVEANRGISSTVFRRIKEHLKNALLESPVQIVGPLLQGKDNAKDGVLIWPLPEHDVDMVRIFISGLSGETHVVKDPVDGKEHLLRKTLMIEYATPGDERSMPKKPFVLSEQAWVVR